VDLSSITERARGDEMSAAGLFWRCPSCPNYTVPGTKKKGGGYRGKVCPGCGNHLEEDAVSSGNIISDQRTSTYKVEFIDGKAIKCRYILADIKYLRDDLRIYPELKPAIVHKGPKIVIRQAGIGMAATLVRSDARCPQSVYIYRPTSEAARKEYTLEYILACLCSRIMNYIILKSFGEIDPARAFAKLTHERMESLPIAKAENLSNAERSRLTKLVRAMLSAERNGGPEDFEIEHLVGRAWGLSSAAIAYVNSTFALVPEDQMVQSLFPDGPPKPQRFPSEDFPVGI
jgi:hypothetical protein